MRFSTAATFVAIAVPLVSAQATHNVAVGQNGLTYSPSNITAAVGDIVSFTFYAKNHSATQSTFAAPCTQLVNSTGGSTIVGISSGYMPVGANATSNPVWSFSVQDTTPLWFFCLQGNHCQQGMVFSINETPAKTFAAYQTAAKATTNSTAAPETGGAQTPAGSNGSTGGAGTTSSPNGNPVAGSGTTSTAGSKPTSGAVVGSTVSMGAVSVLAVLFGVML